MTDTPDDLFLLDPKQRSVAIGGAPYKGQSMGVAGCASVPILFLGIGIVVTLFFLLPMTISSWIEYFRLSSAGVTTPATVVDRRISTSDDSTSYYITYEFRYVQPNGEPAVQRGEDDVSSGEYERLEPGTQIEIFYDPNDPAISDMQPPNILDPALITGFMIAWSGLWNGVLGFMSYGVLAAARKERKLARHGQLIHGTLTRISGDTDSDGDFLVDLHYRFVTPQGREINASEKNYVNRLRNTPLPSVGTPVAIWYADDKTYKVL